MVRKAILFLKERRRHLALTSEGYVIVLLDFKQDPGDLGVAGKSVKVLAGRHGAGRTRFPDALVNAAR